MTLAVRFESGNAIELPLKAETTDVTVSGLVLNSVSDYEAMAREMVRVTKPGGKVAAYVWDYAGGMEVMRQFWDAAIEVTPGDAKPDQARFLLQTGVFRSTVSKRWSFTGVGVSD